MRPILRYHGGKWLLAEWIIGHFPHHRVYVEPFGGAASVLLQKPRSYAEVYNELDGEIVNLFMIVRERGSELRKALELTPFARQEFLKAYKPTEDSLEQARRTVIKSFMSFGSDGIKNISGFRANSNRSGSTPAHDWLSYPRKLDMIIERLRGVVIENRDAREVIQTHDTPDTLHYVDPPYLHSTRSSDKRYRFEMTDDEHIDLASVLHSCKGKVVLSGYPSDLYEDLYKDWHRIEKRAMADGARERTEVLWLNFEAQRQNKLL